MTGIAETLGGEPEGRGEALPVPRPDPSDKHGARKKRPTQATISDVAALAQVSTTTVSRVLSGHGYVSAEALARVKKATELLGYRKNKAAVALRTGRPRTVTVAVSNLQQAWYSKLISALREGLLARDYEALILDLRSTRGDPTSHTAALSNHGGAASILATHRPLDSPETVQALYQISDALPLVVIGQPVANANWATVSYTDREGVMAATRHLLQTGCRRIAYLGLSEYSYLAQERFKGYADALAERAIAPMELAWDVQGWALSDGYKVTKAQLRAGTKFDAIVAINDELAIGAMRALHEAGVKVPDEVSVTGFGSLDVGEYLPTRLTTVDGSAEEVARVTCEALWHLIDNDEIPEVKSVRRGLIVRDSTRPISARY